MFSIFLLFAIRRRLRSHSKTRASCFTGISKHSKTIKALDPALSSVFSCLETPVKHSHSFLKYYTNNVLIFSPTDEKTPFEQGENRVAAQLIVHKFLKSSPAWTKPERVLMVCSELYVQLRSVED